MSTEKTTTMPYALVRAAKLNKRNSCSTSSNVPLSETLKAMLVHVGYEWWMFRATYAQLQTISEKPDVVQNALIESLAIHGRGLILFFYESRSAHSCDVTCKDYGMRRTKLSAKEKALSDWKRDADKRIAHVTDARLHDLTQWRTGAVHDALKGKIDELRTLLKAEIPQPWIADDSTDTIHPLVRREPTESAVITTSGTASRLTANDSDF